MVKNDLVKVSVKYPLRGKFMLYDSTTSSMMGDWDSEFRKQIPLGHYKSVAHWMRGLPVYNSATSDFFYLWKAIDKPIFGPDGNYSLSDEQKLMLVDLAVLPSTRGVEGKVPWLRDGSFWVDLNPNRKQKFLVPADWSEDTIIEHVFSTSKADVFSYQINEGEERIVKDAKRVAEQVRALEAEKSRYMGAGGEGTVTLNVFFPFRALYLWNKEVEKRLETASKTWGWSEFKLTAVIHSLRNDHIFGKEEVVDRYDLAWWAVSQINISSHTHLAVFTDEDKLNLLTILMVPGSRNKYGTYSYVNPTYPELGFIADPELTKAVRVPYRADGAYHHEIKNLVGDVYFWYQLAL